MMSLSLLAYNPIQDPKFFFFSGLSLLALFLWYFATDSRIRKRNVGTVLSLGVVALCIAAITPKDALKGGIDIVGGSSFVLKVQPNIDDSTGEVIPLTEDALKQGMEIIRKRLNTAGTVDMLLTTSGTDTIMVQMPGMDEETSEEVAEQLQKVAKLELREVNRQSDMLAKAVYDGEEVVPGFRAYKHETTDRRTNEARTEYLLLSTRTAVSGSDVASAWPTQTGAEIDVAIKLTGSGGEKMVQLTSPMQPGVDRIAVLLDDEVLTAPVVQSVPLGQNFVIQGQKSLQEATLLANQLMNPLDNALIIDSQSQVSPSTGKAAVKQGINAGIGAMIAILCFIYIYYRSAGFIALIGIAVNGLIIFGAMAVLGASFTMPGIAGIILTIGMSVDANVLIYERLREEIEKGKSLTTAIYTAYEKAFTAIFDSNTTSLLTAVLLFWFASDSVKGFAVTLSVGLLGSLFSAVLVTRICFYWALDLKLIKRVKMLNVFRNTNYDFLGKRRIAFVLSLLMLIASFTAFGVRQTKAIGVDFTGGSLIRYQFPVGMKAIEPGAAAEALKDLDTSAKPIMQEEKVPGSVSALTIRCDSADVEQIQQTMNETFPILTERTSVKDAEGKDTGKTISTVAFNVDSISATAGKTFLIKSGIAVVLGLIMILVYVSFRFEFSFALGAFLAVIHDVVISSGAVALMGGELQLIHIGAILTIAGYSINDTIVIFDRVRESMQIHSGSLRKLMNDAINATLSRTLLTATTTIFSVTLLAIFGGSELRAFSIMIIVGCIIGTYSSIFVATSLAYIYDRRKKLHKSDEEDEVPAILDAQEV